MSAPAKEGIVLDRDGNEIRVPGSANASRSRLWNGGVHSRIRVYRGSWWLPLALGVGIPALLVLGIFFFAVLMTLGIFVFYLRAIFGAIRRSDVAGRR